MPPAPARAEPRKNAVMMTRSTSTPIMRAASGSCAVARMALPMRLRWVNRYRPPIRIAAVTQISTSRRRRTAPPMP